MSAFVSCGRRISAISSPCPGPTATATCPPLDMRRSASSGARASIAPGQMSIARGVPTMRVSSGTVPPQRARDGYARSASDRDLTCPLQIGVVVDLDPLDVADRRGAHAAAAVGELLEAVLVVELRVALPGRLERAGEVAGRFGLDQREADVLALRGGRIERLVDAIE